MTDCNEQKWLFQELGCRKVEVDFGGGYLSSDGGGLILRELERHSGLLRDVAGCFIDYRDQRYVEHSVRELISQRIHGLALGYEDLNDHDHLRRDPVHGLICGKSDPLGQDRILERDKGKALAGASTLNRLELSAQAATVIQFPDPMCTLAAMVVVPRRRISWRSDRSKTGTCAGNPPVANRSTGFSKNKLSGRR